MSLPSTFLKMVSTVGDDGNVRLSFQEAPMPTPGPNEIVIRVEASPINPSDLAVLLALADMNGAESNGEGRDRVLTAPIPPRAFARVASRVGQALPIGNEGAGTVVAAGQSDYAQSLIGKVVAASPGGGMYAEYCCVDAMLCLPLGEGHSAKDGAASFVNPMTALSMIETMKKEGHTALVHTAAASNLGQMLNRICRDDGVGLVNIVRRPEQETILREAGAKHVVNSQSDDFFDVLTDAIHETGATLAFDAIGGGELADQILSAMERAAARTPGAYSVYGSLAHKQVYVYGGLSLAPTSLSRGYGMSWGVGGWLLPRFIATVGMETAAALRMRVLNELTTTFRSHFTDEISLFDVLDSAIAKRYDAKATGQKFLICQS